MRRSLVVALCVSAVVAGPSCPRRPLVSEAGDPSWFSTDPPGVDDPREGRHLDLDLDIERARAARPAAITGNQVAIRLHTYAAFTNADLEPVDEEVYAVAIGISTDRDPRFERLCYVDVRGDAADQDGFTPFAAVTFGKKYADLDQNAFAPRERFLGYALVRRPEPNSIEVTIPPALLALPPSRRFHWQARMVSSPEPGSVFYDYVPDSRLARGRGGK